MNIVKISGRSVPQQMFQYAFALALKQSGDVELRAANFKLPRHFNVTLNATSIGIKERIMGVKVPEGFTVVKDSPLQKFDRELLSTDSRLFDGAWTSPLYFEDVEDQLRQEFRFKSAVTAEHQHIVATMDQCESVAIEIRKPQSKASTCTHDYYNWAVANIRTYIPDAQFFIFTDNVKWAKAHLPLEGASIIDTSKLHDVQLMQLLSLAKHLIMANDFTGWWAGYLCENPDKIVIAPQKWTQKKGELSDLLPLYWVSVPTN